MSARGLVDRRAFLLASVIVLWITVLVRQLVHPADAIAWSYQALMLCLLVAAIAGRSLTGARARGFDFAQPRPTPSAVEGRDEGRDLRWRPAVAWGAVALAAVLPYLHSATIGFVSDDFGLAAIARNARSATEAMRSTGLIGFYRPLIMLLWWLGDRVWQGAPVGYHLLAMASHAANSLLVYAIGRRLIGSSYGALMGALLFAVHPLHVEPVCWPAASADLLCAGFSLLSLLALQAHRTAAPGRGRRLLLAGALAAFVLALLSKEVALALPGVVVLMLALTGQAKPPRARRFEIRDSRFHFPLSTLDFRSYSAAAYFVVLAGYLAWRVRVLGGLGGYALPLSFWNTVFPSNPLLLMGDFLFPTHTTLLAEIGPLASWLALLAMAGALLWWLAGLERVPARRLWLWLGFVFLLAIPSWTFRWRPSASFEWARFGYLPTIGLAWLFGDLCAGRGIGWRRSGAMAACIIVGFAALTVWYVTPWREAGRLAGKAVAAGVQLVDELGGPQHPPVLYVRGLPEAYQGAPVLANCYPQAINLALGIQAPVRVVTAQPRSGGVYPEVMVLWRLKPGEYLVAFDAKTSAMRIVRAGGAAEIRKPKVESRKSNLESRPPGARYHRKSKVESRQ